MASSLRGLSERVVRAGDRRTIVFLTEGFGCGNHGSATVKLWLARTNAAKSYLVHASAQS
jgi:hypothetical protein